MKGWTKVVMLMVFAICLQGCQFVHRFEIKNTTDTTWNIEYEIFDSRGVFRNKVYILGKKREEDKPLIFEGNIVKFSLQPNETASLFWMRNTCYDHYKDNFKYKESESEEPFINIKRMMMSTEEKKYILYPRNFEKVFNKYCHSHVRISTKKVVKNCNPLGSKNHSKV